MGSPELFPLLLTQVWQVALIACAVWAITHTYTKSQPQCSHLLWGLVLIKAITPPIWSSPTSVFSWLSADSQTAVDSQVGPGEFAVNLDREFARSAPSTTLTVNLDREGRRQRMFRQAGEDVSGSIDSPNAEASATILRRPVAIYPNAGSIGRTFTIAWLVGLCFFSVASLVRLVRFWLWVRACRPRSECSNEKHRHALEVELRSLTKTTAAKLGIRREIGIHLVDAPVGPAVVGLFRPAIILPLEIVKNRAADFLEPLVAHELVHIRRGDLFWAGLQSLATSLLWFHPLVWLAARKLTLESERSCDEQTIGWLGCTPKAYARSLIDVLERKHQLRVAPALPGVRPVDVTRMRLERIMNLGQGSRRKTPIWAWAVFWVAMAAVIPGAAFVTAQEASNSADQIPRETKSQPATTLAPPIPATSPLGKHFQNAQIEVGDLLATLRAKGITVEQAQFELLAAMPERTIEQINQELGAAFGVTVGTLPAIRIQGTKLCMFETEEQIEKVRQAVEERRKFGFDTVSLELTFITIPKDRLTQLGVPWLRADKVPESQFSAEQFLECAVLDPNSLRVAIALSSDAPGISVSSELQVPATQLPAFHAVVGQKQKRKITEALQSETRANMLLAPRVIGFSGQQVKIQDVVQRPFVTGIRNGKSAQGMTGQAIIQVAVEGTQVVAQTVLTEAGQIELMLAVNERKIERVEQFTYNESISKDSQGNPVAIGETIQLPQLVSRFVCCSSLLETGETVFLTSGTQSLAATNDSTEEILIVALTCRHAANAEEVDAEELEQVTTAMNDHSAPSPNHMNPELISRYHLSPVPMKAGETFHLSQGNSRSFPRKIRSALSRLWRADKVTQASAVGPAASLHSSKQLDVGTLAIEKPKQYILGSGDVLNISVQAVFPREVSKPNISRGKAGKKSLPCTILANGTISLPLLEPINAKGLTVNELRKAIQSKYVEARILNEMPEVQAGVIKKRSHKIVVWRLDNSVESKPQLVGLDAFENDVLHALSDTGGLPKAGELGSIHILRASAGATVRILEIIDQLRAGNRKAALADTEIMLQENGNSFEISSTTSPELSTGDQLLVLPR